MSGSDGAVLRLLRLIRLLELFKHSTQMQMIIKGLVEGMSSAIFVLVILFLVFYMYAAVGVMYFSAQDPWHFGDLLLGFVTLYKTTTLDNWSEAMYINYYGCEAYPGGKDLYVTQGQLIAENRTLAKHQKLCNPDPRPVLFHAWCPLGTGTG